MLTIRLDSPEPLHDQLVTGLRRLIATGQLTTGDELPPVRQLAADLGINLNTVARAYRELIADGLVASARGRGTTVISRTERSPGNAAPDRDRIEASLAQALADAKLAGLSERETRSLMERQFKKLWKQPRQERRQVYP